MLGYSLPRLYTQRKTDMMLTAKIIIADNILQKKHNAVSRCDVSVWEYIDCTQIVFLYVNVTLSCQWHLCQWIIRLYRDVICDAAHATMCSFPG